MLKHEVVSIRALEVPPPTPVGAIWPALLGIKGHTGAYPVISIITPVKRGGGTWLIEAWNSLFAQTNTHWEWLVELDGNGEMEPEIKALLQVADARLKVASCGVQMYAAACRNMALSRALGRWVLPLDADDSLAPNALELLLTAAVDNDAGAAVGAIRDISADGLYADRAHHYPSGVRKKGETYRLSLQVQGMIQHGVGTLMNTRLLTSLGGYPATPYAQDLMVQYMMSANAHIVAIPEVTYYYRRHREQMTASVSDAYWKLAQWRSRVLLTRMVLAHQGDAVLPDCPVV
jgi:hypothetical protein